MTDVHAPIRTALPTDEGGSDAGGASTCARVQFSEERVAARRLASRLVGMAASATCGLAAIGRSLDVSATAVARFADPEHSAAMTLGDLLAARRDFARAVLLSALASLDEGEALTHVAIDRRALRLASCVGDVNRTVDEALANDGRIDDDEAREIRGKVVRLQAEAQRTIRELDKGVS